MSVASSTPLASKSTADATTSAARDDRVPSLAPSTPDEARPDPFNNCGNREEIGKCSKVDTDEEECHRYYVIEGNGQMYNCEFNSSRQECEMSNSQCGQEA